MCNTNAEILRTTDIQQKQNILNTLNKEDLYHSGGWQFHHTPLEIYSFLKTQLQCTEKRETFHMFQGK